MQKANTRAAKLNIIFARNPSAKGFYVTSDDQAFTLENNAKNHAETLEDKTYEFEARPKGAKASDETVSTEVKEEKPAAAKVTAPKAPAATVKVTKPAAPAKPVVANPEADEKAQLRISYKALFNKNAMGTMNVEQLKKAIAEKEAEGKTEQSQD